MPFDGQEGAFAAESLENFRDEAGHRLQALQATFHAATPLLDLHLPFNDSGHAHIKITPLGKRCW
jgi:hypothetical protein